MQAKKLTDKYTTSINIEQNHKDFLEKNNINLSSLVRETIERLMRVRESLRVIKKGEEK